MTIYNGGLKILRFFKKKLNQHKVRQIRRDLRKKNFSVAYPLVDDLSLIDGLSYLYVDNVRSNKMDCAIIFSNKKGFQKKTYGKLDALSLYVVALKDCELIARTDGFIKNQKVFHPDLLKFNPERHDYKNKNLKLQRNQSSDVVLLPKSIKYVVESNGLFISLLKEHSHNYYHFLFECLPKLLLIKKNNYFGSGVNVGCITILIDSAIPKQCLELLKSLLSERERIRIVAPNEVVVVPSLLYCTPFFDALDNTQFAKLVPEDFYVDRLAVQLVKDFLAKSDRLIKSKSSGLIYLKRKSQQVRKAINEEEIIRYLELRGFTTLFSDDYSFKEQQEIFGSAKCIVGGSGAAFSNMIFMAPDTSAVIFSPDLPFTNYHLFQQQATVAGVHLVHLNTVSKAEDPMLHDDYYINIDQLETVLDVLLDENMECKRSI